MALFNGWPWAQFQEQNLDWLIRKVKELETAKIDYTQFKAEVTAFMNDLNVPEEVESIINSLIADGTIQSIIENIGISALFDGAFLIPEQFKTNNNTWDDAFNLMVTAAGDGSKVLVPAHSYTLAEPHFLPVNTINNAGIYPDQKAYAPEPLEILSYAHPKARKMVSPVTAIQGACIHDGLQAVAEVKGADIYLSIYDYDTGASVNSFRLGAYSAIHAGSVAWDSENNRYVISTGVNNSVCVCSNAGIVQTLSVNVNLTVSHLCKIPGGYVLGDRTQGYRVTDNNFNVLYTISTANMPERPNTNPYTELQDIEYHNGYLYYLWSAFDQVDNYASGFYIYRSDLVQDPTFELVTHRAYDDVIFTGFEAEHLIIDDAGFFNVGAYSGQYYFLMSYNNDNTLLENNDANVTIYVDESLTSYGSGTNEAPYNCLFTGLYYATHSKSKLDVSNGEFPGGNYYGINLVMSLHNTVLAGTWIMCDLEINNSKIIAKTGVFLIRDKTRLTLNGVTYTADSAYARDILMQSGAGAEVLIYNSTFALKSASHHVLFAQQSIIYTNDISSNTNNMFYLYGGCLLFKIDNASYTNSLNSTNRVI